MLSVYLVAQGSLLLLTGCAVTSVSSNNKVAHAAGVGTALAGCFLLLWAPFA